MIDDVGDRIQRRVLSETRQELKETQEALAFSKIEVENLKKEIRTKQAVMDKTIAEAQRQLDMVAEKDRKIEMLKQRVHNINAEYNSTQFGKFYPPPKPDPTPRMVTTLEDVYKLTGESYSKDDH